MSMTKEWWMEWQDALLDSYSLGQITREQFIAKLDEINQVRKAVEESDEPAFEQDRYEYENAQR